MIFKVDGSPKCGFALSMVKRPNILYIQHNGETAHNFPMFERTVYTAEMQATKINKLKISCWIMQINYDGFFWNNKDSTRFSPMLYKANWISWLKVLFSICLG